MRGTVLPMLLALLLVPCAAPAAPHSSRSVKAGRPARPAAPAESAAPAQPIDWQSFPPPDTAGILAAGNAPTTEGADAEVLLDDNGVNFGADGSIAAVTCRVFLLKTRAAPTQFAKLPAAPVGPDNSTNAFVVHEDGKREMALSTRDGVARFGGLHAGDRVVVISHIASRPTRPGVRPGHFVMNPMRYDYPMSHARFWLRYPTRHPVGARAINLPDPESHASGEYTLVAWHSANQPAAPQEKGAAYGFEGAPAIFVDSRPDLDWLEPLCRGYLKLPAGPRLKGVADQLRAMTTDRAVLLTRVRDFVALQIRPLQGESLSPDSLRRLTPDGVLLSGAAGPFGRAVLLSALLRKLGFDPAIALVEPQRLWRRPPAMNPAVALPMVAMPSDKPTTWLNPSSSANAAQRPEISLQGQEAIVIGPLKTLASVVIPVGPMGRRGISNDVTGTLDSSGVITGTIRFAFRGEDADLWRAQLRPATNKEAFEMMYPTSFQMLFNAEPQDINGENFETLGDEVAITCKMRARDLLDRHEDLRRLKLVTRLIPDLEEGPRLTERNLLRLYGSSDQRIELTLPAGWTPVTGGDSASAEGEYLSWSETRSVVDGKLVINRQVDVRKATLPAADYPRYLKEQAARNLAFDRPVEFRTAR